MSNVVNINFDLLDFDFPDNFVFEQPIKLFIFGQEYEVVLNSMISKSGGSLDLNCYDLWANVHSSGKKFLLVGAGQNLKKKQIEEALRKVNDTKEEHKKAQRELSKLLEDK